MIKLTDNILDTNKALLWEPILGARIHTLFSCYGNDYPFVKIWSIYKEESLKGMVLISGQKCTLVLQKGFDKEELLLFLSSLLADIEVFEINSPFGEDIGKRLNLKISKRPLMKYSEEKLPQTFSTRVEKGQPKNVYDILHTSDEVFGADADYPSWLYDTHRRVSRGMAQIYNLNNGEEYVAAGGYYSSSDLVGVIANVATIKTHRNMGYGKEIVEHISATLLKENKTPYLIAASEQLVDFYEKLNFKVYDYTVILKK